MSDPNLHILHMGRIDCNYHGVTGLTFACSHIGQDILGRRKSGKVILVEFPDNSDIDPKFRFSLFLNYCRKCACEFGFPDSNASMEQNRFDGMYEKGFVPVCFQCLTELNA